MLLRSKKHLKVDDCLVWLILCYACSLLNYPVSGQIIPLLAWNMLLSVQSQKICWLISLFCRLLRGHTGTPALVPALCSKMDDICRKRSCWRYKQGKERCPFGNQCWYRHTKPDGTLVQCKYPLLTTRTIKVVGRVSVFRE